MRILQAKAKNFLSYEEFSYDYSAQGLTLIEGYDEDLDVNTGAGKSAFLDVISYGLFGLTSKKLKADEVINWNTKKNLEVELTFEDEGVEYTIKRFRKHKKHENDFFYVQNNKEGQEIRGVDARETQRLLDAILHFNHDLFTKSVYFGQFDAVDKFLSATDKNKKELIGTICDLSAYDDMLDGVKEDIKGNNEALDDIHVKLSPLKTKKQLLVEQLGEVEADITSWDSSHARELQDLQEKSSDWDSHQAQRQSDHEAKSKSWDTAKESELKGFEEDIAVWTQAQTKRAGQAREFISKWETNKTNNLVQIDLDIETFEADRKIRVEQAEKRKSSFDTEMTQQIEEAQNDAKTLDNSVKRTRARWQEVKASDKRAELKIKASELQSKIDSLSTVEALVQSRRSELAVLSSKNGELRIQIKAEHKKMAEGEGDCPHCRQPVSAEHLKKYVDDLTKKGLENKQGIEEKQVQIKECEATLEELKGLKEEARILTAEISEASKIDWELRNLESEGKTLSKNYQDKMKYIQSLSNYSNPHETLADTIRGEKCGAIYEKEQAEKSINPYLREVDTIEAETCPKIALLENKKSMVNPYGDLAKDVNPWPGSIESHKIKENPFRGQTSKINKDLEENSTQLVTYQDQADHIQQRVDYGNFWKEALGVYIRSFLMDSFLEQLNQQANIYLETLFSGVLKVEINAVTTGKKKVSEKISQKIYNGNQECSYEHLSGGERCRVCLAINLALSDITSKTLGKSFSILMLDEIFTGLDSAGKSQTMRLLKELEPRFETIFVIDHTEEFKSLFTNNVMVRKKGGSSTITKESL